MRILTAVVAGLGVSMWVSAGCTGFSTTTSSGDGPGNVGAAIAAAFSGGQGGASSQASPMCDEFVGNPNGGGPAEVNGSDTITAGTYGASTNSVTVTESQDCESDPTNHDAFMSFVFNSNIPANCEDGTTVTLLAGSSGIARNNETAGYYPEIYGTFDVMDWDGTQYQNILCTIFLDGTETIVLAECEDSSGVPIDTSPSTVCQLETN